MRIFNHTAGSILFWALTLPAAALADQPAAGQADFIEGLGREYRAAATDPAAALPYYQAAATQAYGPALLRLARLYAPYGPLWQGPDQWTPWLLRAAQAGYPEAAFELAQALAQNQIPPQEGVVVADLFYQAAATGHGPAAAALGQLYLAGDQGLPQDHKQGEMWLTLAAESRTPGAAQALGSLYYESDPPTAEKWLQAAPEPEAAYLLGQLLLKDKRFVEAVTALTVAAQHNYPEANLALGLLALEDKYGRRPNQREALQNFKIAAQAGLPEGAYQLAQMYLKGLGTPKDLITGAFWLHQAASGQHPEAQSDLAVLTQNFSLGQKSRLERMIKEQSPPLTPPQ